MFMQVVGQNKWNDTILLISEGRENMSQGGGA